MTLMHVAIDFPADEVRVGDTIIDEEHPHRLAGEVTVSELHPSGARRIVLDSGAEDECEPGSKVTLIVPVLPMSKRGVTLYKADGTGVLGCTCVYRLVKGAWERIANSDEHCRALDHGALVEDD